MPELLESAAQFGVAGLMGVLWVFERWLSRKREQQLEAAQDIITAERHEIAVLVEMVTRTAQAIERFEQTQSQLREVIQDLARERREHRNPD